MANESNAPVAFARGTSTAIAQKTPTDGLLTYDKTKKRVSVDVSNGSTIDRIPIDGISLTQAQYDALSASEKANGTYYITDSGMMINGPAETIEITQTSRFTSNVQSSWLGSTFRISQVSAKIYGNVTVLDLELSPTSQSSVNLNANASGSGGQIITFVPQNDEYDGAFIVKGNVVAADVYIIDSSGNRINNIKSSYGKNSGNDTGFYFFMHNLTNVKVNNFTWRFHAVFINTLQSFGFGASTFSELSDVSVSSLTNGQIPVYNSTSEKWENGNINMLSLSDVNISSPTNGQVPIYNSTSQKWENSTVTGNNVETNAAKTGTNQGSITSTIAKSTTMDNSIETLLNNDVTLKNALNDKFIFKKFDSVSATGSNSKTYQQLLNEVLIAARDYLTDTSYYMLITHLYTNTIGTYGFMYDFVFNGSYYTATNKPSYLVAQGFYMTYNSISFHNYDLSYTTSANHYYVSDGTTVTNKSSTTTENVTVSLSFNIYEKVSV